MSLNYWKKTPQNKDTYYYMSHLRNIFVHEYISHGKDIMYRLFYSIPKLCLLG